MTQMTERGRANLRQAMQHIQNNPLAWDQRRWIIDSRTRTRFDDANECGTAACLAGHLALFSEMRRSPIHPLRFVVEPGDFAMGVYVCSTCEANGDYESFTHTIAVRELALIQLDLMVDGEPTVENTELPDPLQGGHLYEYEMREGPVGMFDADHTMANLNYFYKALRAGELELELRTKPIDLKWAHTPRYTKE